MLITTQDNEEIIERVAALDIGKAELVCRVRVPDEDHPGRRLQEVQAYPTLTRSVLRLVDHLARLGVTRSSWRRPTLSGAQKAQVGHCPGRAGCLGRFPFSRWVPRSCRVLRAWPTPQAPPGRRRWPPATCSAPRPGARSPGDTRSRCSHRRPRDTGGRGCPGDRRAWQATGAIGGVFEQSKTNQRSTKRDRSRSGSRTG
jgi:hypothetical protein